MVPPVVRPVADPLDDIDRAQPVDELMARQDRADLPGNRSDGPVDPDGDAAAAAPEDASTDDAGADGGPIDEVPLDDVLDDLPARGADEDDPIDETERLGDDTRGD